MRATLQASLLFAASLIGATACGLSLEPFEGATDGDPPASSSSGASGATSGGSTSSSGQAGSSSGSNGSSSSSGSDGSSSSSSGASGSSSGDLPEPEPEPWASGNLLRNPSAEDFDAATNVPLHWSGEYGYSHAYGEPNRAELAVRPDEAMGERLFMGLVTSVNGGTDKRKDGTLEQTVAFDAIQAHVAAGASYRLEGWLGGHAGQEDYASMALTFFGADGSKVGNEVSFAATKAIRGDAVPLRRHTLEGEVPADATKATVTLRFIHRDGNDTDGYADHLSFELNATPPAP